MIKVEEIAEKYKGYEVDEERLKSFSCHQNQERCGI